MKYLFIFIHSIIYHFVFKMDFFQSLFNSWNLAYPISTEDPNDDNNIIVLFNSIASESPVPLVCIHPIDVMKRKKLCFQKTVWAESLPSDDYQSTIHFHLLHPCDSSILFRLYKLFPSQKLILASKDFLLIQEGAIEILVQYHHQIGQQTGIRFYSFNRSLSNLYILLDISITSRLHNLNITKDESNKTVGLANASFQYVIREYYMIIWAYLFKHNYAFKVIIEKYQLQISFLLQIEVKNQKPLNPFDDINGKLNIRIS